MLRGLADLLTIATLVLFGMWLGTRLEALQADPRAQAISHDAVSEVRFIVTTYLPEDLAAILHAVSAQPGTPGLSTPAAP